MRIAMIHSFYSSKVPSGENFVVNQQMAELMLAGHDVELIARDTDTEQQRPLFPLQSGLRTIFGYDRELLTRLEAGRYDIVHVHNLFPNFGQTWINRCPAPIIATLHNYRPLCARGTLFREGADCTACIDKRTSIPAILGSCYHESAIATVPLALATTGRGRRNNILSQAHGIICLSNRARDTFAEARPDVEPRLHLIPNFLADPGPCALPQESQPYVFVGRLTQEKGILDLLRAWPASGPSLIVVGAGPAEVEARALAKDKPVAFAGQVPSSHVGAEILKSKALVFPSRWREGAPMVYLEAISRMRPVLAIGSHSVADDVAVAGNGVVRRNFEDLSSAFSEMDAQLSAFAELSRERYLAHYSRTSWLQGIESLYESVRP